MTDHSPAVLGFALVQRTEGACDVFATEEDVERAYRELALKLHPDRGGDAKQFARLQRQYELTKKELQRRTTRLRSNRR